MCGLAQIGRLPRAWLPDDAIDANGQPTGLTGNDYLETLRQGALLKGLPNLAEVGEAAALPASDRASAMTGAAANITSGQVAD